MSEAAERPAANRRALWREAAAQVFVGSLDSPVLTEADDHHLRRVLRLRRDEVVCAGDGAGGYRMCRWTGQPRVLDPQGGAHQVDRALPSLSVGFAPVKGDRPEWAVQKLTEIGVDVILVIPTQRSVVRWDRERAERQRDRFEAVARGAAAQCRRLWLPEIRVEDGSDPLPDGVLAEAGGRPLDEDDTTVLVGPEGGWADAERVGRELVALGEHVLRSETAALAAGLAMTALRARLLRSI